MDNNSELNQELNKKLSEALAEESRGSGIKKVLLIAAISLIVLAVVLVVFWKTSREPAKSATTPPADQSLQKVGNIHDSNFENLTLESPAKKQEDKFDKIVQDIQARQAKPENTEDNTKLLALPTSPLDKKPEQPPLKSELHPQPLEQKPAQAEKPKPLPPQHTQEKHAQKHTQNHAPKHTEKHTPKPQKHAENKHAEKKTPHEVKKQPEKSAQKHPEKKPQKATEPPKTQVAHATPPVKQVPQEHPKPKPKPQEPPKSVAKAPTPTPQNPAPKALSAPSIPKGFYLQVGVFSKTPNPHFLEQIKQYPHQVQEINGQKRYLIGPYANREQADAQIAPITEHIGKPVHVEIK
ncbi:SPOR domain-containing protein [Helicobacter bizzozeronii]|uniref:SPOR domain-containing protein n=1 Tax=Helicobacter bizzozeronii TaxID=56877 RepID=UPI000CEE2E7F|nr:SPOR domain-containing protein [Helicobacter bizzozeronii]